MLIISSILFRLIDGFNGHFGGCSFFLCAFGSSDDLCFPYSAFVCRDLFWNSRNLLEVSLIVCFIFTILR